MAKAKAVSEAAAADGNYQVVTNLKHDGVHYGPKLKNKTVRLSEGHAKGLLAKGVVKPIPATAAAAE